MTIGEIVALTAAEPSEGADLAQRIVNVAPLDTAGPGDLSYVESGKYLERLKATRASACLMAERFAAAAPKGVVVLRSREPHRDFTLVARQMYAQALRPAPLFDEAGVAKTAIVHPSARIADGVTVDPGAVIGPYAEIGPGSAVGALTVIGAKVRIGRDCSIGPNCTITHATIGDRVVIHPGCHIGQDGFGYVPGAKGHLKVPQVGSVLIHNDVEIGAATTIDRGAMRDTVIGEGTKIDNLVQIGHNVTIGRHCIIVAQSGISGSVTIDDFAMLGGAVGIAPHVKVGKGVRLAARSGLIHDIPPGQSWGGYPARPAKRWLRQVAMLDKMAARGEAVESPPISDAAEPADTPASAPTRGR
jgi:UDP-3-O-[3-hydroxymyristoyl] glucosamine N-acyltransferase